MYQSYNQYKEPKLTHQYRRCESSFISLPSSEAGQR